LLAIQVLLPAFRHIWNAKRTPALKVAQWNVISELVKWPPGAVGGI